MMSTDTTDTSTKTRRCLSCKHPWPLTPEYWHRRQSSPDGFQARCKGCNNAAVKKWQEDNRPRYLQTQREHVSPLRAEVIQFKEDNPCADCRVFFPYVAMSFDHPPGADKAGDVSKMAKGNGHLSGRARLLAEIEKCDLVCLNCHALRTHERWLLSKADVPEPAASKAAGAGTPGVRVFRRAGHS